MGVKPTSARGRHPSEFDWSGPPSCLLSDHLLPYHPCGEGHIKGPTETGPPAGDARIVDPDVVKEVENSVAGDGGRRPPETGFETHHRHQQEDAGHGGFNGDDLPRSSHRGKQDVVMRDNDGDHRIERAITGEADGGGQSRHGQS